MEVVKAVEKQMVQEAPLDIEHLEQMKAAKKKRSSQKPRNLTTESDSIETEYTMSLNEASNKF